MHSDLPPLRTAGGWSPELFARGQSAILRQVAQGDPLGEVLDALARLIESLQPGILCSVLLLTEDGRHLLNGAAPSLPPEYSRSIDGLAIGPSAGSCGTAAFLGKPVIASDLTTDPRWAAYRTHALQHGLRACWSMPIFGRNGEVLGTFAVYHREPHEPTDSELALVREATDLARIAMEQARDERTLRQSEERYRTLVSATAQAVWVYRADETLVASLSTWPAFTGTTVEEINTGGWLRSIHPDDRERTLAAWVRAQATRTAYEIEHRVRRADGEWRTMIGYAVPIFGENGEIREWIGAHTDVTEQRRVEAAQRESEATLKLALEAAAMGSWTWDVAEDRIVGPESLGPLFRRPTSGEPLTFEGFTAAIHPADRERVAALMHHAHETSSPFQAEFRIGDPSGPDCWIGIRGALVRDGDETAHRIAGVAMDVTEQKRREDEERALETKMQQAQKLETLGVMAGGIAHDFNNLLVGILGNAGLALIDLPPDSSARDSLAAIESAAERAAELVSQMLAYSGRGSFRVISVDLAHLVAEMGDLLGSVIAKNVEVRYQFADPLPSVRADPTQVRQIAMNLITNAAEALGGAGGVIRVTVGDLEGEGEADDTLGLGPEMPAGRYVFLEVADSGGGMDAATQARMFEPFFTTKFTGRGLGLAAVQGIVRSHRGAIRIRSAPGEGTTFRVYFPADATGESSRKQQPATTRAAIPFRGTDRGTVLVADDEETVRSTSKRLIERAGFTVLLATNGREAIELYDAHAGEIVAIFLDLTMPVLSGDAALEELMRRRPPPRVVLTSGFSEEETAARFVGKELAGYLQKPYRAADLLSALAHCVESR
ncbi:MAG TPA: PAS domain-containing protein [Gemmatimonadales bacterium]|jgi:PAS domain S-box-containing protein